MVGIALVGAVVYFMVPDDLIPDSVPVLGVLDDAAEAIAVRDRELHRAERHMLPVLELDVEVIGPQRAPCPDRRQRDREHTPAALHLAGLLARDMGRKPDARFVEKPKAVDAADVDGMLRAAVQERTSRLDIGRNRKRAG